MDENKPTNNKTIIMGLGGLVGLCVCAVLAICITFLFGVGSKPSKWDHYFAPTTELAPLPPGMETRGNAESYFNTAYTLTINKNYIEAIPYWDRIIAEMPENGDAYYYRSKCYLGLTDDENILSENNLQIYQALEDIDKAIAYGVEVEKPGDPYFLRYEIFDGIIGEGIEQRSDRDNILLLELENLRTAASLGTSDSYPEQWLPLALFALDRCEEGWHEINNAKEYYGRSAPPSSAMLNIEAHGYLCLGEFDNALEYNGRSLSIEAVSERLWFRSIILYLMGNSEESLKELNNLIETKPSYNGYRYYLRALIHYENGDRKLAELDLEKGSGNTWEQGELKAYVLGRMALDDGDKEKGIQYLQYAYSTMTWFYRPMFSRIEKELAELGAEPLPDEPQISIFVDATPMPTSVPTAKSNLAVPLTVYGFPIPPNIKKINMSHGTGKIQTGDEPYPYPVLLFQPQEPVFLQSVKNLTLHMEPYSDNESTKFEVFLWELKTGEWEMIKPGWGAEQISNPGRFVDSNGDVYIAIRGDYDVTLMVQNIWLSIEATGANGSPIILGLD